MKQVETRPRSHMVSRDVGRCASRFTMCERLGVTDDNRPCCIDTNEVLVQIGHCVRLGSQCQAEFGASKRPPPKDWTPKKTRLKVERVPQKRPYRKPKAPRRQKLVPCKELGSDSHCKSHYKRCEWLVGWCKFSCPWLGCDLGRTAYGPIRPQECQDEPANEKEEEK